VLLIAGFGCSVANMVDSWTMRRRLDAVITLLQQQEKNRTP
jgi:Fe2+ transport system protein B